MAKTGNNYSSQTPFLSGGVSYNDYQDEGNANYLGHAGSILPTANSGQTRQGLNYASSAMGSGGGTPWGAIGAFAKQGYNGITGHNDKNYSDVEQEIIYPLQGASMGSALGPWGALGGALYGLGYGFRDDLGFIKNNKWLDNIIFPIKLDE